MPENRSRFVLFCQQILAVGTVVAVAAPAAGIVTLDIGLGELVTLRSLKEGLKFAMGVLHDRDASPHAPR